MKRLLLLCCVALPAAGCESGDAATPEDLMQAATVAVVGEGTPEGFVDFYSGGEVRREYEATGGFVPGPDKTWTMVRVPQSLVEMAEASGQPVTVSICNPAYGISLVMNRAGAQYQARAGVTNCTPWVEKVDGRLTATLTSGMAGLRGRVQIGLDAPTGKPFVSAVVSGRLESACAGEGQSDAAMLLGAPLADESPDDPMLQDCEIAQSY